MKRFSYFPPVYADGGYNVRANALNGMFSVRMFQGNAAVLAQEIRELGIKWAYCYFPSLLALLGAAILPLVTGNNLWALLLVIWLALFILPKTNRFKAWMEFQGHETEVQAAVTLYGANEDEYRAKEASFARQPAYNGAFDQYSDAEVIEKMRDNRKAAAKYVARKLKLLRRYQTTYQ